MKKLAAVAALSLFAATAYATGPVGAYGYAHGFAMERYVRDVLVMPIWGGSSAIQKNNIANFLRLPRE